MLRGGREVFRVFVLPKRAGRSRAGAVSRPSSNFRQRRIRLRQIETLEVAARPFASGSADRPTRVEVFDSVEGRCRDHDRSRRGRVAIDAGAYRFGEAQPGPRRAPVARNSRGFISGSSRRGGL